MNFEPWFESDFRKVSDETQWKYISAGSDHTTSPLSCTINKNGRYRISHKEQFFSLDSNITRVHTFVMQNWNWQTIPRAVFDWEWSTAWEIKRITAYGYVECDLHKWDWLELFMLDQNNDPIDSATAKLQEYSNRRSVEYIDLPYNK